MVTMPRLKLRQTTVAPLNWGRDVMCDYVCHGQQLGCWRSWDIGKLDEVRIGPGPWPPWSWPGCCGKVTYGTAVNACAAAALWDPLLRFS